MQARQNNQRIIEIGACQSKIFWFIFLVFSCIVVLIGLDFYSQLRQSSNNKQLEKLITQQEELIEYYDNNQLFDYGSEEAGASISILNSS